MSVSFNQSGDAENMAELSEGFANAMTFGLILVYAVLVLLFGSFFQPVTILFSLPLSIGGAIIALLIGRMQLTLPVSIGILMLMGIVTKNAIMLVDFAIGINSCGCPARRSRHRRRTEACSSYRDDHDRNDCWHDPERACIRRRR